MRMSPRHSYCFATRGRRIGSRTAASCRLFDKTGLQCSHNVPVRDAASRPSIILDSKLHIIHHRTSRLERQIRLRHSVAKILPSPTARADTLVVTKPRLGLVRKTMRLLPPQERKVLCENMVYTSTATDTVSLIVFAAEFKRCEADGNFHQLIYDLSTAQPHRRALSLPDQIIFGAVSAQSVVEIHGSWRDENVRLPPHVSPTSYIRT
jgi:hypothetical protein